MVRLRSTLYPPRIMGALNTPDRPMPWKCPACHIPIRHSESEERPRPNAVYRCHICRLELVFNPRTEKMNVAAMRNDDKDQKERSTR